MPVIQGLGWTFDTVADTYAKLRPGYVAALYQDIFAYCPLDASSHAVEVGIGGGQATRPVLETGCTVTAVEPGEAYAKYYHAYYRSVPKLEDEYTEAQAIRRAEIAAKYGFIDIQHRLYRRTRVFTAAEYVQLLGTYSDHIAIEESIRKTFFAKIREAILRHGGTITIYDTIDLQLARKP